MDRQPWHIDPAKRLRKGDDAEKEWMDEWCCFCGGRFQLLHTYNADFTCDNCGLLLDVKTSPATERWNNITISERPLDSMPDDQFIVVRRANDVEEAGRWVACRVGEIEKEGPFESTHKKQKQSSLKPTRFYKVSLRTFAPAEIYGFQRIDEI